MARGKDYIKVEPGDTKEFRFDSAEPEVKDGRYGDYYLYDVDDGEILQASSFLKDLLEKEDGFGDGALVEISCMSKGKKREYEVAVLEPGEERDDDDDDEEDDRRSKRSSKSRSSKRSSSHRSSRSRDDDDDRSSSRSSRSKRTLDDIAAEYSACLAAAVPICEAELRDWTSEDQRSIATTLYIQAQREGAEIPKG